MCAVAKRSSVLALMTAAMWRDVLAITLPSSMKTTKSNRHSSATNASAPKKDSCECFRCGTADAGPWTNQYCPAGDSPNGRHCKTTPGANGCYSSRSDYGCDCPGELADEFHTDGCMYEEKDVCFSSTAECPWGTQYLVISEKECIYALELLGLPGQNEVATVVEDRLDMPRGCFSPTAEGARAFFNKVNNDPEVLKASTRGDNHAICQKDKSCPPASEGCKVQSSAYCLSENGDCPAGWDNIVSGPDACTWARQRMGFDNGADGPQTVQVSDFGDDNEYPLGCYGHGGQGDHPWFNPNGRLHTTVDVNAICQRLKIGEIECINPILNYANTALDNDVQTS